MNSANHNCRISVRGLAMAGAVFLGGYLFLLAILAGWGVRFMWVSEELVEWLSATLYPGYVVGVGGAIIGLLYGLICGAVCGSLVAWLHNIFCGADK